MTSVAAASSILSMSAGGVPPEESVEKPASIMRPSSESGMSGGTIAVSLKAARPLRDGRGGRSFSTRSANRASHEASSWGCCRKIPPTASRHAAGKVDLRIIAAMNRNLPTWSRKVRSAKHPYYRLNVFPITIPPLRSGQRRHSARRRLRHGLCQRNRQGREAHLDSASNTL